MKIDAHQHFWKYNPVRDSWITDDMKAIQRDFMPVDLEPLLKQQNLDGCVAVQADQSEVETNFLIELATVNPWIKGVVGWVDLKSDQLEDRLTHFSESTSFKGVRHILQAEPRGYMTDRRFVNGVKTLSHHGLTYDILTHEGQLDEVLELVGALPEMPLVVDHLSKPGIKTKSFDHWAKYMKLLSEFDHVHVKLSGMVTEADWDHWSLEDLQPYIDFCLEHFGAKRLMYGADWPVCLLAGTYERVIETFKLSLKELSEAEQEWIMGETAVHFYNLS